MELSSIFTLSSTTHYTIYSPIFSFSPLVGDSHPRFVLSSHNSSSEPPSTSSSSTTPHFPTNLRRPKTTLKTTAPTSKTPSNPLKNLRISQSSSEQDNLTPKLRLTTKLSPPPPPSLRKEIVLDNVIHEEEKEDDEGEQEQVDSGKVEFRQEGKIFVGNLPLWIKKPQVFEFFRQFGDIKSVILIKGHNNVERNLGFGFVIYDGPNAEKSASKAVEFDGVEFHGRVLTIKLDDGRRRKTVAEERQRWLEKGGGGREYRSKWHEERDGCRVEFRRVLESQPENWQAVVRAFERVKKPSRKEYGLMVKFYARRGDMHRARETFESMRARGIEPTSHVFTSLIHAYAVGRDMDEALSCVRKMKEEGIELSLVTYSILVGGFARVGSVESMVQRGKRQTYNTQCNYLWQYHICLLPKL